MFLEQAMLETVRALPAEKQREVLQHATCLRQQTADKRPLRSVKGLWADLGISLSAEEITENQREMWRGFAQEVSDDSRRRFDWNLSPSSL
jgi:hypothetical protein